MDLLWPSVPPLGTVDDKFEPENVELHCYDCLDAPDLTLIPPYEAEDDSAASSLCLPSLDTTSSPAPATNAISSSYGNLGRQMRVPLSSLTLADMRLFQEHNALGNVLYSGTCCTAGSLPVQQQSKQAAHPTDSKLQQVEGGGMGSAEAMEWAAPESSCNDEQLLQRVLRQQDVRQLGLYASGNVNLDSMSGGSDGNSDPFAATPLPLPLASVTNSQAHAPASFGFATASLRQPTDQPDAPYLPAPCLPSSVNQGPFIPAPSMGRLATDAAPAAPSSGVDAAYAVVRPQAATKHPSLRKKVVPVRHQQAMKEADVQVHPCRGAAAGAGGSVSSESGYVPWPAATDGGYATLDAGNVDVSATITALSSVGIGGAPKVGQASCKSALDKPGDQVAAKGGIEAEGKGGQGGAAKSSEGQGGNDQKQDGFGGKRGGVRGHGSNDIWKGGQAPIKPTQGGSGGGDERDGSRAGSGQEVNPNARNHYADAVNQALEISLPGMVTPAPATASECTKILAEVNKCVSTLAVGLVNNLLECLTIMGYEDEAALAMAEGNLGQLPSFEAHPFKMVLQFSQCFLEMYIAHAMKNKRSTGAATAKEGMHAALAVSTDVGPRILKLHSQQLRSCALDLWALMHVMDPRPDGTLKDNLATYTGRTRKQVTDWFTNWRARHWKTVVQGIGMSLDQQGAISNDEGLHVASEEE